MIQTKWPRLIVVGEPVAEAQADEILIRTNSWHWLSCNDSEWERTVQEVAAEFGYPPEVPYASANATDEERQARSQRSTAHWKALEAWLGTMGVLQLEYLGNAHIMSSYIGGPHGWCDWSGRIGCDSYNIGKWPSDDEVTTEWQEIVAAFPFLDLTAQCVDEEGEGRLAAEWRVCGGTVTYVDQPARLLAQPTDDMERNVANLLFNPYRERGVSVDRLRQALERVA